MDKSTNIQVIVHIQYIYKDESGIYKPRVDYLDIINPENQSAIKIKVISCKELRDTLHGICITSASLYLRSSCLLYP